MHWRRKWQPIPVFLPGESQEWWSLVGCHLWGCTVRHNWSDLAAAASSLAPQVALVVKNLPMQETQRDSWFDPWVGKILWRSAWQSTLIFLPEKFHGQRSLVNYSPWGCKETQLSIHSICFNDFTILIFDAVAYHSLLNHSSTIGHLWCFHFCLCRWCCNK